MSRHQQHPRQHRNHQGARNQPHEFGRGGGHLNPTQIDPTAGQSDYFTSMEDERNFGERDYRYGPGSAHARDWDENRFSGKTGQDSWRHRDDNRQYTRDFGGGHAQSDRFAPWGPYNGPDSPQRAGRFNESPGNGTGVYGAPDSYDEYLRSRTGRSDAGYRNPEPWTASHYPQRGQMPKGYTRSDERIKDDVIERLYHAGGIDLSDISVDVKNGTVALSGTVAHRSLKHRIEDICENCIAVTDVENRIRVARTQGNEGFDKDHSSRSGSEKTGSSGHSKEAKH